MKGLHRKRNEIQRRTIIDMNPILVFMILFIVITEATCLISYMTQGERSESIPKATVPWNLREMKMADGKPAQEALEVYTKLAPISGEELPKGIRIDWARAHGNDILVVFERYRYLNRNLDRDYIAVFDAQGRYQYGFEGYLTIKGKNEIAFLPDREGIMIRNWRFSSISEPVYLLIEPDGNVFPLRSTQYWGQDPEADAHWDSDLKVIDTANSRLVIRHDATGEERVVFDYSDEYLLMYPSSSKIDEESERLFGAILPAVFLIIMTVFVLPRMMDNPDIPKRGIKIPYGDLRDRWR